MMLPFVVDLLLVMSAKLLLGTCTGMKGTSTNTRLLILDTSTRPVNVVSPMVATKKTTMGSSSTSATSTLKWFGFFAFVRILNVVWLIQSQFDPDEYWQNLEPSYCLIFWQKQQQQQNHIHHSNNNNHNVDDISNSDCPGWTWEWKRRWSPPPNRPTNDNNVIEVEGESTMAYFWWGVGGSYDSNIVNRAMEGPVRSFASIIPTLILYWFLRRMGWDTRWMVAKGPLVINAVLVAAVTDTCVWYASQWMDMNDDDNDDDKKHGEDKEGINKSNTSSNKSRRSSSSSALSSISFWCAYCSLSSWFNAYALVRTYSNSLETVLLTLSLVLVGPELFRPSLSSSSSSSVFRACLAFFLGGICSSIRFTCLTAYIPIGIMLAFSQQRSLSSKVSYLFGICALFGSFGLGITLVLDRMMYGFWVVPVLGNFHFNVIQGYGSLYGVHPFHWYLTAGIPALTGMLLPVLLYDLYAVNNWTVQQAKLWIIISYYVVAHSFSAHKEFRFLLPILPMFCLLAGSRLRILTTKQNQIDYPSTKTKIALGFGVFVNLVVVLYLGCFHQRAPIDVNQAIVTAAIERNEAKTHPSSKTKTTPVYRIHYLMGCHSTPLLSHLHHPGIKFEPWYLDCSPDCRSDPDTECESDAFSRDPRGFVERVYGFPNDTPMECLVDGAETCEAHLKALAASDATPDFIVCYSEDLHDIRDVIELLGMVERERFIQGINGLQIGPFIKIGKVEAFEANSDVAVSTVNLFQNFTVFSLDEMILFEKQMRK
jgi:GPI mannosyltransferase 3